MNKVLLVSAFAATALLAACGDKSVARAVTHQFIVVDAPVVKPDDACYLRVRPKGESMEAPRLMRFDEPNRGSIMTGMVTRYNVCTLSKPGDLIVNNEFVREPAPTK